MQTTTSGKAVMKAKFSDGSSAAYRRRRRLAGFPRLAAGQVGDALPHKVLLPTPHHRLDLARSPYDLGRAAVINRRQANLGAPNMFLRRVAIDNHRPKVKVILGVTFTTNSCSHNESFNRLGILGIARMNHATRLVQTQ